MATGRISGYDDRMRIELVFCRVGEEPVQGTAAVFHGGRSARDASEAIVDVHDRPTHLEVGSEPDIPSFFGAFNPATSMDHEDNGNGLGNIARQVKIELERNVVRGGIGNVGGYGVTRGKGSGEVVGG